MRSDERVDGPRSAPRRHTAVGALSDPLAPPLDAAAIDVAGAHLASVAARGWLIPAEGALPAGPDLDRAAPEAAGLEGKVGSTVTQTYEKVRELPLHRAYRTQLDSTVADPKDLAGVDTRAITAALFLAEFAADTPWAHLDIADVAQIDADRGWHTAGCSWFGARLLLRLALDFRAPRSA